MAKPEGVMTRGTAWRHCPSGHRGSQVSGSDNGKPAVIAAANAASSVVVVVVVVVATFVDEEEEGVLTTKVVVQVLPLLLLLLLLPADSGTFELPCPSWPHASCCCCCCSCPCPCCSFWSVSSCAAHCERRRQSREQNQR